MRGKKICPHGETRTHHHKNSASVTEALPRDEEENDDDDEDETKYHGDDKFDLEEANYTSFIAAYRAKQVEAGIAEISVNTNTRTQLDYSLEGISA